MSNASFQLLQRVPLQISRRCVFGTNSTKLSRIPKIHDKFCHNTAKFLRFESTSSSVQQYRFNSTKGVPQSIASSSESGCQQVGEIFQGKASKLLLAFTCKKCSTRVAKFISKIAYKQGIVIVKCSGCEHNHLIADNLGWFPDLGKGIRNIEQILEQKGESVSYCLTDDNATEILGQISDQVEESQTK